MRTISLTLWTCLVFPALAEAQAARQGVVSGELKRWHTITLTFDGPASAEDATPNPFMDYRLDVTFEKDGRKIVVPGYFAADGDAGETGAKAGNKWRAHFVPDQEGRWRYTAALRTGKDVAVATNPKAGTPRPLRSASGTLAIGPSDKVAPDFRARGRLRYVGKRYLEFAGTGETYLKGGADSPENLLAYQDFDDTPPTHKYEAHARDWKSGDPTWRGGKGKALIGALNYLASKGMNSVYFLTMNVVGDGKDVWPWTSDKERLRYDVSKLAQWDIVFQHMERKGLKLHVVTQETENDQLLDQGELGPERRLYLRELVARFGHHLALVWNLGEENTNTDAQRKAFAEHLRALDPYDNPVVIHTYPGQYDKIYTALLGDPNLDGPSLQMGRIEHVHAETIKWLERSARAGRPWFVSLDEIGPADTGVVTDAEDPEHDEVRKKAMWGHFMAGGAGVEWYFGYKHPHHDLNAEDWRTRDRMWDQTRIALEFFQKHIPFGSMSHADGLTTNPDDYVLADVGKTYAVYLPNGGSTEIDLGSAGATFTVEWFNPRAGGGLVKGAVTTLKGPGRRALGAPPSEPNRDWVAVVKLSQPDVKAESQGGQVYSFTLIDADTDQPVRGFENLRDGAVVDLTKLGVRNVNVRANTSPVVVGSVRFDLDGKTGVQVEGTAPYALGGETNGDYNAWTFSPGEHTLTATPFEEANAKGKAGRPWTVKFTIQGAAPRATRD